jgi:hypothetical protein
MWVVELVEYILGHLCTLRVVASMVGSSFIFRHRRNHVKSFPPCRPSCCRKDIVLPQE